MGEKTLFTIILLSLSISFPDIASSQPGASVYVDYPLHSYRFLLSHEFQGGFLAHKIPYRFSQKRQQTADARVKKTCNVFDTPSSSAFVIGSLEKGVVVEILNHNAEWRKIRSDAGVEGWLSVKLLEIIEEKVSEIKPPVTRKAFEIIEGAIRTLQMAGNVYDEPALSSFIIGTLSKDEVVTIQKIRGDWLKVKSQKGLVGWVKREAIYESQGPIPKPDYPRSFIQTKNWLFLATGVLTAGASYYFHQKAESTFNDYENATSEAAAAQLYSDTVKNDRLRNGFLAGAGALMGTYLVLKIKL